MKSDRHFSMMPPALIGLLITALFLRAVPAAGEQFSTQAGQVVYIVDTSCSMSSQWQTFMSPKGEEMSGYRIDRARAELGYRLGRMSEEQSFDIVVTDLTPFACFGDLQSATASVIEEAQEFVGNLVGGGERGLGPAVEWALLYDGYEQVRHYLLISGGPPLTVADTEAYWRDTWQTIDEANSKEAVFHIMLVSPDESSGVIQFAELLAERTGGSLIILE